MNLGNTRRHAFTLVELLIAMTITLVIMGVLARAFGSIGNSIQDGRSEVALSGKLRGLSFKVRSSLRSRTADANPPLSATSGKGYFMFHEGPLTESTFANYGAEPVRNLKDGTQVGIGTSVLPTPPADAPFSYFFDAAGEAASTYRRFAQYGDFDDVLAFTAEAPGDSWFSGKVPRYIVDDGVTDDVTTPLDERMEPTVIRSKFAEIIIWASPVWSVDEATRSIALAPHPSGMPLYRDIDNNLIPDKIVLHQRTLLIRPDLNERLEVPSAVPNLAFVGDVIRPLRATQLNPNATTVYNLQDVPESLYRIYPIGGNQNTFPTPPAASIVYNSRYPNYAHPNTGGTGADHRFFTESNWLVGMAPLYQFFDLSLRRVVHPRTGDPTPYVACNSLSDLTQPHNRFGHVRYPGRFFGHGDFGSTNPGSDFATSMPLLATGWNDVILRWQGDTDPRWNTTVSEVPNGSNGLPAWFPRGFFETKTRNLQESGTDQFVGLFQGWLLPHFELGNPNPPPTGNTSQTGAEPDNGGWYRSFLPVYDPRWDRTGEDILATNITAFDVKGFDRNAPIFAVAGQDARAGRAGVDDDGLGGTDQIAIIGTEAYSELGFPGSDDETVTVNDLGIYGMIRRDVFNPSMPAAVSPAPADDVAYSVQGLISRGGFVDPSYPYLAGSPLIDRTTGTYPGVAGRYVQFFNTELSQFTIRPAFAGSGIQPGRRDSLKHSGKMLFDVASAGVVFSQPTYDTWTDYYETDGFDQTSTFDADSPDDLFTGTLDHPFVGTIWVCKTPDGGDPLRDNNRMVASTAQEQAVQIDTGTIDPSELETTPPFPINLQAVSVSIRLNDPATEQSNEYVIIEDLQ